MQGSHGVSRCEPTTITKDGGDHGPLGRLSLFPAPRSLTSTTSLGVDESQHKAGQLLAIFVTPLLAKCNERSCGCHLELVNLAQSINLSKSRSNPPNGHTPLSLTRAKPWRLWPSIRGNSSSLSRIEKNQEMIRKKLKDARLGRCSS